MPRYKCTVCKKDLGEHPSKKAAQFTHDDWENHDPNIVEIKEDKS